MAFDSVVLERCPASDGRFCSNECQADHEVGMDRKSSRQRIRMELAIEGAWCFQDDHYLNWVIPEDADAFREAKKMDTAN